MDNTITENSNDSVDYYIERLKELEEIKYIFE